MNDILKLKGQRFEHKKRGPGGGGIDLPKTGIVKLDHLKDIHESLEAVERFWKDKSIIQGVLISVYYNQISPKSNRIDGYLKFGSQSPNESIVGAKFNNDKSKHIITHYVSRKTLRETIEMSKLVIALFPTVFGSEVNYTEFRNKSKIREIKNNKLGIPQTIFQKYVRSACFVEQFGVEQVEQENMNKSIISFFDVGSDIRTILKQIRIDVPASNKLDMNTLLLDENHMKVLFSEAPYLVSMAVEDFSKLSHENIISSNVVKPITIPKPTNEPVIGVIDTLFDSRVYFNEWVEYQDLISSEIQKEQNDYTHGTAVTSLIVDGPTFNQNLDDGCGRFRVKHFGVSLSSGFTSFSIVKKIKEVVIQNPDIKVWNLSLGSNDEINENFISAEGATLDEIQFDYDVIFVIAGTNGKPLKDRIKRIGAPADSLNSIVVNAVDLNNNLPDYKRNGIVLSFFVKPDVAYYGGGNGTYINVCTPNGLAKVAGTSYAAPLIARKLAYLIYVMNLQREEAKAVLIDSAIPWRGVAGLTNTQYVGYGIVPISIEDVLSSGNDEIKFIVSDTSEKYDSYNYHFPVPTNKQGFPYVSRVTMCYFPKCSRNQGVDYTDTELNVIFGPIGPTGIKAVNDDKQHDEELPGYTREVAARKIFRKWDNVKHISEKFSSRKQVKQLLIGSNKWGLSVKRLQRLHTDDTPIKFGIVITLKELNGVNRIEEFIQLAQSSGWFVNRLHLETQVDIYNKMTEEIEFE